MSGLKEPTNSELARQIKTGFHGVHERQDKTNGQVSTNTKWIWRTTGAVAVITAIGVPILVALAIKFI